MIPDHGTASPPQEPMAAYRELRRLGLLQPDPAQQLAVEGLQNLYRAILDYRPETGLRGWLARCGLTENGNAHSPMGLYLCGPVGRGKSMLMGLFFAAVPGVRKRRVHFHAFMLEVHDRIERVVVDRLADQPGETPVAPPVELEHVELFFEQRDKREKELVLQAMLVEPLRWKVGRRHDDDPRIEKCGKQAP